MKFDDVVIYLPILVMVLFFGLLGWMVIEDIIVTKECNALSGCEVHKCFQDNSVMIFQQTRRKYGKLPKDFEYHHIKPYKVNVWLGVYSDEHQSLGG